MDKNGFNPKPPIRQSNRLPFYDYSLEGSYFVTICQYDRQRPVLKQSGISTILEESWYALPQRFTTVALDQFMLMPDHLHFILWLHPDRESHPSLGRVVGAYKSITARAILHDLRMQGQVANNHLWQRDYYEHVIRNEEDLNQTREYILNNPLKALELQIQSQRRGGRRKRPYGKALRFKERRNYVNHRQERAVQHHDNSDNGASLSTNLYGRGRPMDCFRQLQKCLVR